jgi:ADP-ribosylarginine hydrolase
MEERYIATFILHAVGDTIGYKNGEWEFNYDYKIISNKITLEIVYDFIERGGINDIDLSNWHISDDTYFHIATGKALLTNYTTLDEFADNLAVFLIEYLPISEKRDIGITTKQNILKLKNGVSWKSMPYTTSAGGNGAAMRTLAIGLAFYNDEPKLIEYSIVSSKLTHNCAIGYLAGMTVALFTSYAIRGIPIKLWVVELIKILESKEIRKYINLEKTDELRDYTEYMDAWMKYNELRFNEGEVVRQKSNRNLVWRLGFYEKHFTKKYHNTRDGTVSYGKPGTSGYGTVIFAYDCLLDAGDKWETLVFYAMLHHGDSDTVGCIAGGLYGALYGMSKIPKNNIAHLEEKETLIDLGKNIFSRYSI